MSAQTFVGCSPWVLRSGVPCKCSLPIALLPLDSRPRASGDLVLQSVCCDVRAQSHGLCLLGPRFRGTTAEILTAHPSNRKRLMRRGMKHLLRRHQPGRQPLGMVMPQERLQHLAIGCKPVGPEVVPHQFTRSLELLVDEGQRTFAGRGVLQLLEALCLRLF